MAPETVNDSESPQAATTAGQGLASLVRNPRALVGWMMASRLRLAIFVAVVLMAIGGAISVPLVMRARRPVEPPVTLAMALEALDGANHEEAERVAAKLDQQGDLPTEEWGGPAFVRGVVAALEADRGTDKQKTKRWLAASKYLQQAYDRGFPPGREAEGLYLLGKSMQLGGRTAASRSILYAALKTNPQKQAEIHGRLADAWLNGPSPSMDKALAENEKYLADTDLAAADRAEGLLRRAKILFRLGRLPECVATLDEIPEEAGIHGEVAVLRGKMLYGEAQSMKAKGATDPRVREKYQAAIETFRRAQGRDTVGNHATPQAMYLIGMCLEELGDHAAALAQMSRTAKLFGDTPEGLAATFREGQIARQLERDATAVAAYRQVLKAVAESQDFYNPWISLKELQSSALAACQDYLAAGKYDWARQLVQSFHPLFPRAQALAMSAHVHRTWGQNLLDQAERLPRDRAEATARQGRTQLRRAGAIYERLARIEFTSRQYPDRLWNSAMAYFQGHDYRGSVRILEVYLRNEARKRHAQGLVELGESLLALGQWDKALQSLEQCIDQHPRDAVAYRARLLASRAAAAKGDFKRAEAFLQDNLSGEGLTPVSKEWRESLIALGELLHSQGRWTEAIRRLEEAATRYPDLPQTLHVRYLVADSLDRTAQAITTGLKKETTAVARAEQTAQARRLLEKALGEYQVITEALGRRNERELTSLEKAMLRNSRFAIGETCFNLGRYEESLQAYTAAANRYSDSPEVLDAYLQIANVYRRLDRPAEARTSLEQAKVALRRFPGSVRFEETTNYNRKQWGEVLDWVSSL